jgi:hypothetical protein
MSVWRVTLDIVRPQIVVQPGEGNLQFQLQWAAEAKV